MKFPVIFLVKKKNGLIFEIGNIAQNFDQLTTRSQQDVRNDVYRNGIIVDSAGCRHNVIGTEKARSKGAFFGFSLTRVQAKQVDLILDPNTSPYPLSELKELAKACIDREKYFWNEALEINSFKDEIQRCETHEELISLFIKTMTAGSNEKCPRGFAKIMRKLWKG